MAAAGLAKDPVTGLNKFQQNQKDAQAAAAAQGGYKPPPTPTAPSTSTVPQNTGVAPPKSPAPTPPKIPPVYGQSNNAVAPPTYNEQSQTNYGGSGNSLNEILYSKKQYDAGNKDWAANNAQNYYNQLDPNEANAVKGMNTQQLIDYINSKNQPAQQQQAPNMPGIAPPYQPNGNTPQQYQSSYTGPDITGMTNNINNQYSSALQAQLQKLRDARDQALLGYTNQENTAQQNAYDNRNQSDTVNMQNQQAMKETMANAGLTTDGQNLTLQAGQNAQRLGDLGAINRQEANSMQDIAAQRALLNNNEAANELGLQQQVDSDKYAALQNLAMYGDQQNFAVDQSNYGHYRDDINQQFAQDQFNWQQQQDNIANDAQYGGTYGNGQSLQGQQAALDNKNANWNAYMDMVGQTGNLGKGPTQTWGNLANNANAGGQTLNGQQQQFNQNLQTQQFDRDKYESDRAYQQQVQQQDIANGQWQQQFNQDVQKFGFDKASELWSQSFQQNQANQKNDPQSQQRSASANEVQTLLENLQLQGQDSEGKSYAYVPGKNSPTPDARKNWVQQSVKTLVDSNYDNATIEQVLRKAGISQDEEDQIFGSGK